ncbi:MAG TPA: MarR family transcriptional regulator [Thermoleophilia bacterium]
MHAELTPEQRELVEEFGLLHEQMGGTRMTGRISGWLLLCDPPVQSLTEIAEGLGVSKAAVSGAARLLLQSRIVERVGEPGQRGDFYRAVPADPEGILPLDHVRTMHRLIERGLATVTGRDQSQSNYALMHDLLEFTGFIDAEMPALLERWRAHRANASQTGDAGGGDLSPPHTGGTT